NMSAVFDDLAVRSRKIQKLKARLEAEGKSPTIAESSEIGKEVKKLLDRKREEESEEIIDRLKPLCTSLKINNSMEDGMVLDVAFLVDRLREIEFDDQIDTFSQRCADRFRFKYVGPIPPFNFVNIVVHWGELE
ncbi:MAG: GvpL/GvpF family gas vesicle protein, partial [Candidatus Heimdallarchaeota archaeon]